MSFGLIFRNLIPLIIFCVAIAVGLLLIPNGMIRGFLVFGKFLDSALRLIVVFCVVEYFTGFFSDFIGHWGFDPIIGDADEPSAPWKPPDISGSCSAGLSPWSI